MSKIGRNDPCPCGSGKKYKRCCLHGDDERQKREQLEHTAPGRALAWLHERHGEAMQQAFRDEFFGSLDEDALARLQQHSEDVWQMVDINGWELVLAEGKLGKDQVGCLDLLFGPGGPLLDAVQRQWLEKLRKASLSLYEVVESNPGAGFKLRDLIDRDSPALWVQEHAGSRSAGPGTVIGARIIPGSPNKLSGAIYGFPEPHVPQVLEELRAELGQAPDPDHERRLRGMVIVDGWLRMLTMPPPTIVGTNVMDELGVEPHTTSSRPLDPSEIPEGTYQQLYEQIYGDWADEPIPALGDRTPRQAIETPEGKRRVVELLESYERGERKEAKAQRREVADLSFIWRELGLERDGRDEPNAT